MVISPNLTPNLLILSVRDSSALDLTVQIYGCETVGTGVPRHIHIPLLFFRRNSGQNVDF